MHIKSLRSYSIVPRTLSMRYVEKVKSYSPYLPRYVMSLRHWPLSKVALDEFKFPVRGQVTEVPFQPTCLDCVHYHAEFPVRRITVNLGARSSAGRDSSSVVI